MSVYADGSDHSSEVLDGMELLEVKTLGLRVRGVQDPGWVQDLGSRSRDLGSMVQMDRVIV